MIKRCLILLLLCASIGHAADITGGTGVRLWGAIYWNALKARAVAPTAAWTAFLTQVAAEGLSSSSCTANTSNVAYRAHAAAVIYRMDETTYSGYGDCAAKLLIQYATNATDPPSNNEWRAYGFEAAAAYDLLRDSGKLTSGNRDCTGWATPGVRTACAYLLRAAAAIDASGPEFWYRTVNDNYVVGAMRANIWTTIAVKGETGVGTDAETYFDRMYSRFTDPNCAYNACGSGKQYAVGLESGGVGHEGTMYDGETWEHFYDEMWALVVATDATSIWTSPDDLSGLPAKNASYLFYSTTAAQKSFTDYSSHARTNAVGLMNFGDYQYSWRADYPFLQYGWRRSGWLLYRKLVAVGDTTNAAYMRYWLTTVMPSYGFGYAGIANASNLLVDFLCDDEGATTNYKTAGLPLFWGDPASLTNSISKGMGHIYARSDWTATGKQMLFVSGPNDRYVGPDAVMTTLGHNHQNALALQFCWNGVCPIRMLESYNASNSGGSHMQSSLMLNRHSQGATGNVTEMNSKDDAYDVGPATTSRYEGNATYVYVRGDATQSYQNRTCSPNCDVTLAQRDVLALLPVGLAVVSDVVTFSAYAAHPSVRWNWVTHGTTTVSGNQVTLAQDSERAAVTVLTPAAPTYYDALDNRYRYLVGCTNATTVECQTEEDRVTPVTLAGASGGWTGLNNSGGPWTATLLTAKDYNSFTVPWNSVSAGTFAGQKVTWDLTTYAAQSKGQRAVVEDAEAVGTHSGLSVIQLYTNGDSVLTPTALTVSAGSVACGEFSSYVVCGPSAASVSIPITYSGFDASAGRNHYVMGLDPNTTYKVDLSTPGTVNINASTSTVGTSMTSSAAGILAFTTSATSNPGPVGITTTSLPSGTANAAYSTTLAASGGTTPYVWSIASGSLPAGLTLASGMGVISGTPTGAGTSSFTVQVADSASPAAQTASKTLSITIGSALGITTTSLPNGNVSAAYSVTLTASGGTTPYAWSITSGGLPAGLALASSTGVISGTLTAAGTSTFTVQVADSTSPTAQTASKTLSVTIGSALGITTVALPAGAANAAYSTMLVASGGTSPYVWSITSSSLPAGLTLTAGTGVISGTPTTAGTSTFTVRVTDSTSPTAQTSSKTLSITINPAVGIATTTLPNGTANTPYSATLGVSGGTSPYTWSVISGALPAGLTLASSTGVISGTPTTAGTSSFQVRVSDSYSQTASQALSITINSPSLPLSVTTTSLPNGRAGTAYSATLGANGGAPPYAWSIVSGSLPAGLTLSGSTGVISGTPTTAGTSSFTVQVKDATAQTASKALSITVTPVLLQSAAVEGTGVKSLSRTFAGNNTAGNLIIAFVRMSSTLQSVAVTDSAGNAYTDAVSQVQTSDGHQIHIFYASNVRGGSNTVAATFSSTNRHPWLAIYEYRGVSTLDVTARAQGASNSPNSGLTAAASSSGELVFAGLGLPSSSTVTVTAGSSYVMELQDTIQFGSHAANEDRALTATGSVAGTFSMSGSANWTCAAATFK